MPNRTIREVGLTSKKLSRASDFGERLYWRLYQAADDFGRFHGDPLLILARCFPYMLTTVTSVMVEGGRDSLAELGLLILYRHDGDLYVQITKWDQRVRASKSKFPSPNDGHSTVIRPSSAPEERGSRIEDRGTCPPYPPRGGLDTHTQADASTTAPPPRAEDPNHSGRESMGPPQSASAAPTGETPTSHAAGGPNPEVAAGENGPHPSAGETLQRPPAYAPEYVLSCAECVAMLTALNDSTARFYRAPGRSGEWMHQAHQGRPIGEVLRAIKRQVRALLNTKHSRYLAPDVMFKPSNWDTTINDRPAKRTTLADILGGDDGGT